VALPDQLFYNTGISTYVWIVTNRKEARRQGKVQLLNAASFFQKMRKSLGNKRNEISEAHIQEIKRLYENFEEGPFVKILKTKISATGRSPWNAPSGSISPSPQNAWTGCRKLRPSPTWPQQQTQ